MRRTALRIALLFSLICLALAIASCTPKATPPEPVSYPSVCGDGLCTADELATCEVDCNLNLEPEPKIITSADVLEEMRSRVRNYTPEERIEQSNPVVIEDQDLMVKSFASYLPETGFRVASRNNLLGLDESLNKVVCTLSKFQLREVLKGGALRSNTFAFGPRAAAYEQFMRLRSGKVIFGVDDETELVTTYLLFKEEDPVIEYDLVLQGGIFKFFEGEKINFLGHEYYIESASNTSLKLVGVSTPDTLLFRDQREAWINDDTVSDDILKVNVSSYFLRVVVLAPEDIRILPGTSLTDYLRKPEILLTNRLDIDYEGLTEAPSYEIKFDKGNDKYRLIVVTNQNITYSIPLAYLDPLNMGSDDYDLVYKEGDDGSDYVVNEKDYFLITNNKEYNGLTNVLRLIKVDEEDHLLLFEDPAFEKFYVYFKGKPGLNATADLIVHNVMHKIRVGKNQSISIDLNGDGNIGGDIVPIITAGNARVRINHDYSDEINISIITPKQLRENNNTDLEVNLLITRDGIQIQKSGKGSLEMSQEQGKEVLLGMTEYGALFILKGEVDEDDQTGEDLIIQHPIVQRFADVIIKAYE
ncbi:hypothetical protein JXB28_04560 [Candidatus Woesearchaeota archaeon]|nr:hypothetical protein [Candidatus Woesearchaeota archaeon]